MIDLMEKASLDLEKASAIAKLICPDGLTDRIEAVEPAMAALEDAIRNGREALEQAIKQALAASNQKANG